ncbi:MAG: sporulation protein [Gemmatimonadetes bacterium]|nr:sporulation protein [Gemmatimonadota bacterium]|tara:strand:+ start:234 stop:638 length:405 start_codon:yes stop_codon:yes gene_type:complete
MSVEDLIKTMMQEFRQISKTETVVGEPITAGGTVVVPVSKVSLGFGAGGGGGSDKADGSGSGTAGGASVEPVAFVVIKDGKAQILPIAEKEGSLKGLLDMAPDILKKVKDFKDKRDKKKAEESSGSDNEDDIGA